MSAGRIRTSDSGYAIHIIAAGKEMSTNVHYTVKMELAILVSILFFVKITEICKMLLENSVQDISAPGSIALGSG